MWRFRRSPARSPGPSSPKHERARKRASARAIRRLRRSFFRRECRRNRSLAKGRPRANHHRPGLKPRRPPALKRSAAVREGAPRRPYELASRYRGLTPAAGFANTGWGERGSGSRPEPLYAALEGTDLKRGHEAGEPNPTETSSRIAATHARPLSTDLLSGRPSPNRHARAV